MKNGNVLIALVVGGAIGFVVGKSTTSESTTAAPSAAAPAAAAAAPSPSQPQARPAAAVEDGNTVYKIAVGDAVTKGPETAKVSIIVFSEFQCPFCARVLPTIQQIHDTYGKDVRVSFKHNPLPFHQDAPLAAEASLAANEQGKFWEYHDKLFANQRALKRADLERFAGEVGLDLNRFKAALDSGKYKAQVERDKQEAATFGARGTPTFFINGRKVRGAQPFEAFKTVIDEELGKANAALARGVKPANLYAELTKDGLTRAAPPPPPPSAAAEAAPKVAEVTDLEGSPFRGPANAKVTLVMWSEFECPFCARVKPTLEKVLSEYPKDVKLVFKHQPLSFHKNAKAAAVASMAAHKQGKFWEFHDKAFENTRALSPENYEKWAQELGLNMAQFRKDLNDPALAAKVDADSRYGSKFGANGTPTFFINGREFVGAQPFEAFQAIIDEEIKKADDLLKAGTKPAELYAKLIDHNVKNAPKAPEEKPVEIDAGNSPFKGAKNAKVTVVAFSDFECPFCSRVNPTLDEILKKYDGKVKVVFKNQPLTFHRNAKAAAEAALAAGEQGKFWEFHDKLFANQRAMQRSDFEGYARELGLDMGRFTSALDSGKFSAQVEADIRVANSVGATGTPTFFINGRKLVGAQPVDAFAAIIDDELSK